MRESKKLNSKKIIIWSIITFFLCYAIFEARSILEGPNLIIYSPSDNITVKNPVLDVRGRAKNIFSLTINGRPVFITPDGLFYDKLLLMNGYNTIEVKVKDKFDQESSKILSVVLHESKKITPSPVIDASATSSTIKTN